MRGDQLAQTWGIRAIKVSPNGLTARAYLQREETGISAIYLDLQALQATVLRPYKRVEQDNCWVVIDTFKFNTPPFLSRRAANFPKKSGLYSAALKICIQFVGRISQIEEGLCALGALV